MALAKNLFGGLISVVVVLIIAAGIFLYFNFGGIAKTLTERIATNALGVKVNISTMDISLEKRTVVVNNLRIANPPGYEGAHAMTAEKIIIGLNTASKQMIDFDDINVVGSVVNLEVTPNGTNLTDLKELAMQKKQKEAVGSEAIRVIVRKMGIGASTLNPRVTLLPGQDLGSIKIPAINLNGIGEKENGVLAKEAIVQVITKYIGVAQREANKAGMMKGLPTEELQKIQGGLVEKAKDDVEKLKGDIGNLFKKRD
jgi:hypothetical protein